MQFTPQQLSGGQKFSCTTRIGNWHEEVSLEEARLSDFRGRSKGGNLAIRKLENKISLCTQKVAHSSSEDGYLRFGDTILLEHDNSGTMLTCDPFEDYMPGYNKFTVSCAQNAKPMARNTFVFVRPPGHLRNLNDSEDDDVLRIGQAFCLMCNEALLEVEDSNLLSPALYLCSTKKNERSATKITNRQLVFMSPAMDAEAIWMVTKASLGRKNSSECYLSRGYPVVSSEAIQLTHRQTNCYLSCDPKQRDHTDFGVEIECYAGKTNQFGKVSLLVSEFKGESTSETLTKPDSDMYNWHFVCSQNTASMSSTSGKTLKPPSDTELLQEFRAMVLARGCDGFWSLRQFFTASDSEFAGKIDRQDLKEGLICWGCSLNSRYIDRIIEKVDVHHNGMVDFFGFMAMIRGCDMSPARTELVNNVFAGCRDRFPEEKKDSLSVENLRACFNGAGHPLVLFGNSTEEKAFQHVLVYAFGKGVRKVQRMSGNQFLEYYEDLSASVDNDEDFVAMVANTWNKMT